MSLFHDIKTKWTSCATLHEANVAATCNAISDTELCYPREVLAMPTIYSGDIFHLLSFFIMHVSVFYVKKVWTA